MDKSIKNERERDAIIKWSDLDLSRGQTYYLYVLSITGLLFLLNRVVYLVRSVFTFSEYICSTHNIVFISILIILLYLILRIRTKLSYSKSNLSEHETNWFGIVINRKQAPMMFLLGLVIFITSLYEILFRINFSLLSNFTNPVNTFSFIGISLVRVLFSIYTIIRMRKLTSKETEKRLWFGFNLNNRHQLIIYLLSIFGMLLSLFLIFTRFSYSISQALYETIRRASILQIFTHFSIYLSNMNVYFVFIFPNFILLLAIALGILIPSIYSFWVIRSINKSKGKRREEKKKKGEKKEEEGEKPVLNWLSLNLSRTKAYHLWTISIIGLVLFTGWILGTNLILIFIGPTWERNPSDYSNFLLTYLAIPLITMILLLYTLLKIRKYLSKSIYGDERREISWFGVKINQNQASLLFGLSLIGFLFSIPICIYGSVSSIEILISQEFVFYNPIPLTSISFFILIFSLYTLIKVRKLTYEEEKGGELWFGYRIESRTQKAIYLGSIMGIGISLLLMLDLMEIIISSINQLLFDFGFEILLRSLFLFLFTSSLIISIIIGIYSFIKVRRNLI